VQARLWNFESSILKVSDTVNISKLNSTQYSAIMATTNTAPATYKQPSRKGKKAWRKNVDVTQLQDGLEDVRGQIIQG
jgi:hypothetical protein